MPNTPRPAIFWGSSTISSQRQISARSCLELNVAATSAGCGTKPYCTGKSARHHITGHPRPLLYRLAASTISCGAPNRVLGAKRYKTPSSSKDIPPHWFASRYGTAGGSPAKPADHGVPQLDVHPLRSVLKEPSPLVVAFVIAADEINEFFVPQPRTTACGKSPAACAASSRMNQRPRIQPQPSVAIRYVWPFGQCLFDDVIHGRIVPFIRAVALSTKRSQHLASHAHAQATGLAQTLHDHRAWVATASRMAPPPRHGAGCLQARMDR